MKVDELKAITLNHWFLKTQYHESVPQIINGINVIGGKHEACGWGFVGTRIEQYKLQINSWHDNDWIVYIGDIDDCKIFCIDKDLLIAIKKCIVKIKYGEEINE